MSSEDLIDWTGPSDAGDPPDWAENMADGEWQQTPDPEEGPDRDRGPTLGGQWSGSGPDRTSRPSEQQKRKSGPDRTKGYGPRSGLDPEDDPTIYADVASLLAGKLPEPPQPTVLRRGDGRCLFYPGQVNSLFGDPESGKTFVALAAATEVLNAGGRVLVMDLDHNGEAATIGRLLMLGASRAALSTRDNFRYIEPEDAGVLRTVVEHCRSWLPHAAVVDSIGELMPMVGADSNSADDFTRCHTRVLKPLAMCGAAVIGIDHLAKGTDSRSRGPGGTAAKRRAVGGVSLRVKPMRAFTPGKGGTAKLFVNKDRHGGVRQWCAVGDREPAAGTFTLRSDSELDATPTLPPWSMLAPMPGDRDTDTTADPADLQIVQAMDPEPRNSEDVRLVLRCRKDRANLVWAAYRSMRETTTEQTRFTDAGNTP